jgi:antitoxin Phd
MLMKWQIQEARMRFSEMLERTLREGPQTVTRHGKSVAVLISVDQYQLLSAGRTFKELLASAPLPGIEIKRSRETARIIRH